MDGRALTSRKQQHSMNSPDDDRRQVAGLIVRLLLHFWAPSDLSDAARKAMAADWVDDLREFGPDIVSVACGEWRRAQSKRPTIADIRRLAIEEQTRRAEHQELAALPSPDRVAQAERRRYRDEQNQREGRALANEWAQRHGYETIDAYATGERVHIAVAYERCARSFSESATALKGMQAKPLSRYVQERLNDPVILAAARRELGLECTEVQPAFSEPTATYATKSEGR